MTPLPNFALQVENCLSHPARAANVVAIDCVELAPIAGQHASDLALRLTDAGHQVTVVTSRRAYDDADKQFAPRENWRGVQIIRLGMLGFGKGSRWRRAAHRPGP